MMYNVKGVLFMGFILIIIIGLSIGFLVFNFFKSIEKMPPLKEGRTMFDGMSRQEVEYWISIAPNWKKLDKNVVNAVLNRLYGKDFLDVFMAVTEDPQVIHEINQIAKSIRPQADKEMYDLIVCPMIASHFTKKV